MTLSLFRIDIIKFTAAQSIVDLRLTTGYGKTTTTEGLGSLELRGCAASPGAEPFCQGIIPIRFAASARLK